jgi:hypothetical protein|tara:strand:+ start:154 stop:318 length:165 start_codon:yes stop_codon:yes gene_type:complete
MKIVFDDDREDVIIGVKKDAKKEVEVKKPKSEKGKGKFKGKKGKGKPKQKTAGD